MFEGVGDFDVLGGGSIAAATDVLGPWAARPSPEPSEGLSDVVFAAGDPLLDPALEELIWRVRLSRDRALADRHVSSAEAGLEFTRNAVARAERRMALPMPAAALANSSAEDTRSCRAFLDSAGALLSPRARVQTYVETRLIGWTILPVVGQVRTAVDTRVDARAIQLHLRAVDLTILSRATLMRLLLLIARAAARWSAALATPLAPAAGVVAAWKTADDILREEGWFRNRLQAAQSRTQIS